MVVAWAGEAVVMGRRGQCQDAEVAGLGDRCGGTQNTVEDSQSHKGSCTSPRLSLVSAGPPLPAHI